MREIGEKLFEDFKEAAGDLWKKQGVEYQNMMGAIMHRVAELEIMALKGQDTSLEWAHVEAQLVNLELKARIDTKRAIEKVLRSSVGHLTEIIRGIF